MEGANDERPRLWVGHLVLRAPSVRIARDFWVGAGMRDLQTEEGFAVLELRGGTHLVLVASDDPVEPGSPAPFDLMVEDLDATHAEYTALALAPSEIQRGDIHDSFTLTDPSGYVVTVNSTHVSEFPV